jgi:hypothetical protein
VRLVGTLNEVKSELLMSDLLQCEVEFFRREMKILSVRCQDGMAFQLFRNCHCIRCRYLMMETGIVAETYEIYSVWFWRFSERIRYINVTLNLIQNCFLCKHSLVHHMFI